MLFILTSLERFDSFCITQLNLKRFIRLNNGKNLLFREIEHFYQRIHPLRFSSTGCSDTHGKHLELIVRHHFSKNLKFIDRSPEMGPVKFTFKGKIAIKKPQ